MLDNNQKLEDNEIQNVSGGYNGPLFMYTVKKGDSLSALAQLYGTTVETLVSINNIPNADKICTGSRIKIPYKDESKLP